jgi:3-dehydroquinate synthase
MAARIPVLLKDNPYEVIVGHDILARTGEFVGQALPQARKCALVTDANVGPLYAEAVRASLEASDVQATVVTVPAGETSKALSEAEKICDAMVEAGLDRGAFVAALGGGVVGDLAGFVAAIYYRGIPHVQIPTSVVAQVDSAIGGKTGVNSRAGKNLIGAFHQPTLVISDPAALETLPKREFNEGLAEIIKHAIIRDASLLDELEDPEALDLPSLVARNVKIKARIVAEDEFEKLGLRALLNFGHTIGHAIENTAGYGRYLHGEAISLGLVAALNLSVQKAGLPATDAARVKTLLKKYKLPVDLPSDLATDALLAALRRDKKFAAGQIRFVLTETFGTAFVSEDLTEADLRNAIEGLRG